MSRKSAPGALTKELNESVTNLLGPNVKISLKCLVKMEIKADKTDTKILAFSACRLFILAAKVPTKIEQTFHYFDINGIESKRANQLTLTVTLPPNDSTKTFTFCTVDPEDGEEINLMIIQLGTAIKTIFPQVPLELIVKKIEVFPETRLHAMLEYNEVVESKAKDYQISSESGASVVPPPSSPIIGPCGNFSTQYACMCDYFGLPYREEVAWDVDTIYFSHNITELSLLDFEHLDSRDLVPIIAALAYNGWFTKFRANGIKLVGGGSGSKVDQEVGEQLINLLRKSTALEEIFLENTGTRSEFANKLMNAVMLNGRSSLNTIDLSHNFVEDKGIRSLCQMVAKSTAGYSSVSSPGGTIHRGLIHLNLSRTGITSKGISELADSLALNKAIPATLSYLNLSDNLLKDDASKLLNFLAQPNCIVSLDLSGTDISLDSFFGALLRGCTQKLAHINLARNQFSAKKSKDVVVPPSFKTFFSTTSALKSINLSSTRLPNEALKAMLLGLACNEIATDVYINLSCNDLKSSGAAVLELCVADIRCLSGLDLSENGLEAEASSVINAISRNKSLKRLSIGRNFTNIKPKYMPRVLDSLVQLLQDVDASLESLSIADSKLRNDTCLIINALSNNQSLVNIDITGNMMGLPGAKTLAKALQVNSKLESIYMDRNLVPTAGFIDIAYALERNIALKHFPIPIQDVNAAIKVGTPEKIEAAISKIEELLRRNNLPPALLRGPRGMLSSVGTGALSQHLSYDTGTYQLIDKLMVHVKDILGNWSSAANTIRARSLSESADGSIESIETKAEYVVRAENYLKEANNAKQLFTKLHQQFILAMPSSVDSRLNSASKPIEPKLNEFVLDLKSTLEAHVQDTTALMLQCVQEQCPNVILNSDKLQHDLQRIHSNSVQSRHFPSNTFLQSCLVDQVGSMITYKLEEVLLAVAANICDRVLDEVIESLSSSHRILTESGTPISKPRSSTPDVLRNRTVWFDNGNSSSRDSSLEGNLSPGDGRQDDDHSSENKVKTDRSEAVMATPKLPTQKRQSLYARRLRPQSVMDGLTVDDFPDLLPKADSNGASSSLLDSGPSSILNTSCSGDKLEHLGKSRPKRPKTRAPTRAAVVPIEDVLQGDTNEDDPLNEKVDDGLDGFFKKTPAVASKPLPAPRTGLARSFVSPYGSLDKANGDMSASMVNESDHRPPVPPHQSSGVPAPATDCTRSISSPNLGLKRQQSQPAPSHLTSSSPRNSSPGADEISAILNRVSSPIPPEQHADLLAEMRAKGGKRSLAPTPTPSSTADDLSSSSGNTVPAPTPAPIPTPSLKSIVSAAAVRADSSSAAANIRMRASAFGDVLKSPSKSSLISDDGSLLEGVTKPASSKVSVGVKQRPKSVVGLLAKFESGAELTGDGTESSSESVQSSYEASTNKSDAQKAPKGKLKKTLAVFKGRGSVDSASSSANANGNNGSTDKSDSKKITRSKFYTSSSLSTAAKK